MKEYQIPKELQSETDTFEFFRKVRLLYPALKNKNLRYDKYKKTVTVLRRKRK